MLKKTTVLFILASLVLTALASCAKLPKLVMYTGGERGTYYNLGMSIAALFTENEDTSGKTDETRYRADIKVVSSSGYKQNIDALVSGEASLAIVRNDIAYFALNGAGCYKGKKVEGFSAVAHLYREVLHIVAKSGMTSVSQLEGCKISFGDKGGANEVLAEQILSAYGIKDYEKVNMSLTKSIEAFKGGEIDAFFVIAGKPSSTVEQLSMVCQFSLLPIEEEMAEAICEKYPYFSQCTVSKREYSILKKDFPTIALYATLLVSDSVDEDTVYSITERLAEDTFLLYHDKSEELLPENMWKDCCVPLNDGSARYYKKYLKDLEKKKTTAEETTETPEDGEESDIDGNEDSGADE